MNKFEAFIEKVGSDIKGDVELAATDAEKALAFVTTNKALLTGLAGLAGTKAQSITSNALGLYGTIAASVQAAGEAASANGLSVTLDAATIANVKADMAAVEGFKV